jgi:hypothetical protein
MWTDYRLAQTSSNTYLAVEWRFGEWNFVWALDQMAEWRVLLLQDVSLGKRNEEDWAQ